MTSKRIRKYDPPRYTICDAKKETLCRHKLCDYILELHFFSEFTKQFAVQQKEFAERLIYLSTRYNILDKGVVRPAIPYPLYISNQVVSEILVEKNCIMVKIKKAIGELFCRFERLKEQYRQFTVAAADCDWSIGSPFMEGTATQKPLGYYFDLGCDIGFHYHVYTMNVRLHAQNITLANTQTMYKYIDSLKISKEFRQLEAKVILFSKAEIRLTSDDKIYYKCVEIGNERYYEAPNLISSVMKKANKPCK